ncbi:FecCD family ABC transporter permease [Candidatus Methanoprimaticola sp. MG2]|uniref:FecCD family ABC transporter permease n=1 Tax=Candidatus Methanoprimaticola sp. MG2 TaxID=3228838 RepID=UPI0039C655E7
MFRTEDKFVEYRHYTKRKVLFVVVCVSLAFLSLGLSIYVGARDVGFLDVYGFIFNRIIGVEYAPGSYEAISDFIVCDVRLPRAVFALVAGAGLAVGGAIMQNVMNNPLADPYTTGISSGACFGVAVSVILGVTISVSSQADNMGVMLNAFIFALIPVAFILAVGSRSNASPATLILTGVAISYIFNALTTVLMMMTNEETLAVVYRWQVGSLSEISWSSVPLMAIVNIAGIFIAIYLSRKLNVLALGDESAKALGLNVEALRLVCMLVISFMVASVICYAGIISFVGLVSAHIVRILIDSDNKFVIPASAAVGALFMITADTFARFLSPQDAIPVGVMLSFIGAPIFLYLIIRQKRAVW